MARLGRQIPSSLHTPLARRLDQRKFSRTGLSDILDKQHKTDRRPVGKQIPSSLLTPLARRLHQRKFSRNGMSDILDKQHKTGRRTVVKMNHGIKEKILLVLIAACILLITILQLQ